jgi:hypothetical protein
LLESEYNWTKLAKNVLGVLTQSEKT